jgi:D-beta-D-heptose 7-phosphate kinase/D-beta-D-heptose 1-phosphate adenosyltransferase
VEDAERPTAIKTRYIARGQQLLRVDREKRHALAGATEQELIDRISARLPHCDGVAIIDYHKGSLTGRVLKAALARCETIPAVVDPRGDDYAKYAGAWVITPNHRELEIAMKRSIRTEDEFAAAGGHLLRTSKARAIAMKRGGDGITLATADGTEHHPTVPQEVYDVTGAGDAVSSVYLVALAGGMTVAEATDLANLAGGAIVRQIGVGRLSREELARAAGRISGGGSFSGKVVTLEHAAAAAEKVRSSGRKVVFTNGCFDLIHPGHVYLLDECRKRGDFLVVGINSDESIKRIKGPSRPILFEAERAEVVAALSSVDAVVIFDEDTPRHLIEAVKPDVLAKGGEYAEDEIVGARFVRSIGGDVARIPLMEGKSTSDIVTRVQNAEGAAKPNRRAWRDE